MEIELSKLNKELILELGFESFLQGEPGITPHIGENGNWWIGNEDTGKPASVSSSEIPPHNLLPLRDAPDAHPIEAITGLQTYIDDYINLKQTTPNPQYTRIWMPKI